MLKSSDDQLRRASQTVITCCVLHNICTENGDEWEDLEHGLDHAERGLQGNNGFDGEELREKLKRLCQHNSINKLN